MESGWCIDAGSRRRRGGVAPWIFGCALRCCSLPENAPDRCSFAAAIRSGVGRTALNLSCYHETLVRTSSLVLADTHQQNRTPRSYPAGVPRRGLRGLEGLKARVERRKSAPVLAWKGASTAQVQLQSAALAQSVAGTTPRLQEHTIALCCCCCGSGKTGKRAQRPLQRCCHLLLQ